MRAFTNWCARCLPLRISIVSCSRSSSLSFTAYFFTAISFAATNHLHPCGADASIQRFTTKSMTWGSSPTTSLRGDHALPPEWGPRMQPAARYIISVVAVLQNLWADRESKPDAGARPNKCDFPGIDFDFP